MTRNQLLELFPVGAERPSTRRFDPVSAIGAAVGGIGSIVGGVLGSNAAGEAAKIQQQNAQQVAQMAKDATTSGQNKLTDVIGQETANLNPYLAAGAQGANTLSALMQPGGELTKQFSFDPSQIANTPEYQFQLQQGNKAIARSAAAKGLLNSGGTLQAADQFTTGLASQAYQQAYNNSLNQFQTNRNNTLSSLMALTGIGEYGTSQFDQAQQNYGNEYANLGMQGAQVAGQALTGGANAAAAGKIGQANAWSGALQGVGSAINGYSLASMMNPGAGITGKGSPQMSGADMESAMGPAPTFAPPAFTSSYSNLNGMMAP